MQRNTYSAQLTAEPREVVDSRGRPTAGVVLRLAGLSAWGDVPAGASKGEDEACTVPVERALANMREVLLPLWRELNCDVAQHASVVAMEEAAARAAGANFAKLGANATLPMSRALWALAARLAQLPLWAYIRRAEPQLASSSRVLFMMNIFNGGLHALRPERGERLGVDRIEFQEIMVVPTSAASYRQAMAMGERIDGELKGELVRQFGAARVARADEAGFSVQGLGDNDQAIALVVGAIERAGYRPGTDVKLALDVAASSFYEAAGGVYRVAGQALDSDGMIARLEEVAARYPGMLLSIEDGLAENDWDGWARLSARMRARGIATVGDDLFVTQLPRLQRGIERRAADAVLIKVNQNGTVHGTLQVIKAARMANMTTIVSHRSGETLDDTIADLALATGALGLKAGDPQPPDDFPDAGSWVRRAKYLRMVAIEEDGADRAAPPEK